MGWSAMTFFVSAVMAERNCTHLHDASLVSAASLAHVIRSCGFAHISPGLFPPHYVKQIAKHVRRWDGNSTDVHFSGADGGRINVVPPPRGPFAEDKPFRNAARSLFETMQHVLGPGEVC